MKPETAIEYLKILRNRKQGHEKEALELAIKALKHMPAEKKGIATPPMAVKKEKNRPTITTVKGTATVDAPPADISGTDPNKK